MNLVAAILSQYTYVSFKLGINHYLLLLLVQSVASATTDDSKYLLISFVLCVLKLNSWSIILIFFTVGVLLLNIILFFFVSCIKPPY